MIKVLTAPAMYKDITVAIKSAVFVMCRTIFTIISTKNAVATEDAIILVAFSCKSDLR